jgi:hypothetical protein
MTPLQNRGVLAGVDGIERRKFCVDQVVEITMSVQAVSLLVAKDAKEHDLVAQGDERGVKWQSKVVHLGCGRTGPIAAHE